MNNIIKFPKKKLKRKYVKKKRYVIAQVPKFKTVVGYGQLGIKEMKKDALSFYKSYLDEFKRPDSLFHFIKIPPNIGWEYKSVCKYVDKQIKGYGTK